DTSERPFTTRETVAIETPACWATCLMVTRERRPSSWPSPCTSALNHHSVSVTALVAAERSAAHGLRHLIRAQRWLVQPRGPRAVRPQRIEHESQGPAPDLRPDGQGVFGGRTEAGSRQAE